MLSEQERITADDPRIVHRTRGGYALVLASDLFYVFAPPLFEPFTGQYRWSFGFKSKSAAVQEARRLAKLRRSGCRSLLRVLSSPHRLAKLRRS